MIYVLGGIGAAARRVRGLLSESAIEGLCMYYSVCESNVGDHIGNNDVVLAVAYVWRKCTSSILISYPTVTTEGAGDSVSSLPS
jgi:hypothetical protein